MDAAFFSRVGVSRGRGLAVCLLTAVWSVACSDGDRKPLPDWSEGYDIPSSDGGSGDAGEPSAVKPENPDIVEGLTSELPADSFGLGVPEDISYPVRLRTMGTVDTPCAVREGEAADIVCIMEMDELDIFGMGITYDIASPAGLCDFVIYHSYIFENWPVGFGPATVSWVIDEAGKVVEEVNAENGTPYCPYDYSKTYYGFEKGPNCCLGHYTRTVYNQKTGEVDILEQDWGGNAADCYEGAAFLDTEAVVKSGGFPMGTLLHTARQPFVHNVAYEILSDKYGATTIPLANYWDPEDHGGGMPAALEGDYARPYYEFVCTDDAFEMIARIRLLVREWNSEVEFDKDGNPDAVGEEDEWGTPIDDLADWKVVPLSDDGYPRIASDRE